MSPLALVPVAVWAVAVTTVALLDSVRAAALTGAMLVGIAALSVSAARRAARPGARRTVDSQVALGVALPVVQLVGAVGLFAAVMFVSTHDAVLAMLVTVFAGTFGLLTARTATRRVVSDVRAVRDGLVDVGSGRRDGRIEAEGSAELAELAEAANRMTERLAAEERARRNLIAAISHDLRTPLTSLRLVTEALGDEILDESERRHYVDRLRLNIAAMHDLIEDLFELSRLEAGDTAWSMQEVDLAMLVGDTIEAMEAGARAKHVDVVCEIPEDLVPVRGNPEKLQRVLFNLLDNAIRHTPARTTVTVLAARSSDHVEVDVADEGPGIPAADSATVFDAFVQAGERTARGHGGAGLGLAIARAIVEAHGGRTQLVPADRGARVRFSVPVAGG